MVARTADTMSRLRAQHRASCREANPAPAESHSLARANTRVPTRMNWVAYAHVATQRNWRIDAAARFVYLVAGDESLVILGDFR